MTTGVTTMAVTGGLASITHIGRAWNVGRVASRGYRTAVVTSDPVHLDAAGVEFAQTGESTWVIEWEDGGVTRVHSKRQALEIAKKECSDRGGELGDPVRVLWGLFHYEVWGFGDSRGGNLIIRIRKRDGKVVYAVGQGLRRKDIER